MLANREGLGFHPGVRRVFTRCTAEYNALHMPQHNDTSDPSQWSVGGAVATRHRVQWTCTALNAQLPGCFVQVSPMRAAFVASLALLALAPVRACTGGNSFDFIALVQQYAPVDCKTTAPVNCNGTNDAYATLHGAYPLSRVLFGT